MREIMLDTETTGLSPKDGDRIVEIGCVEMINRFPTGEVYHQYVNPQRSMPKPAFDVHGLSEEFLSNKPLFADLAGGFLEFIDGAKLVIHNAPFDIGFLNFELEKVERSLPGPMSLILCSWRARNIQGPPIILTRFAGASISIIHRAKNMARCWIANYWPRSILN